MDEDVILEEADLNFEAAPTAETLAHQLKSNEKSPGEIIEHIKIHPEQAIDVVMSIADYYQGEENSNTAITNLVGAAVTSEADAAALLDEITAANLVNQVIEEEEPVQVLVSSIKQNANNAHTIVPKLRTRGNAADGARRGDILTGKILRSLVSS